MEDCAVTQSFNSTLTGLPTESAADINCPPSVMGAVAVQNSDDGEKPEAVGSEVVLKRGRGRPRKNNCNLLSPTKAATLLGFSTSPSSKRGRGRPRGSGKLQMLASTGGIVSATAGGSFIPHVMTVNTEEDVVACILSLSNIGHRALCILSAIGTVSSVTISQPDSSDRIFRYEGSFEILSLSGSYTCGGGTYRKSLSMRVSLAKPDGNVFGGGVEGSMIAAGPIQLIVGSFKQNIGNEIKRRMSPGSSGAADMPDGSMKLSSQVPRLIESEQSFPSPTSGLMLTSNGLPDHVMPGTSNGLPDHVMPGTSNGLPDHVMPGASNGLPNNATDTTNGLPDNLFSPNLNLHSASLNGVGLDCHVMQPFTAQMTFGDFNDSVSQI